MRCAYLTLDEVNQGFAEGLATETSVELEIVTPRDMPAPGEFDALLIDLDSLPPGYRKAVMSDLLVGRQPGCAAVHSYHSRIRDVRPLRRHGVIVARRLEAEVFRRLRKALAVRRKKSTKAPLVACYDER